MKKRTVLYSSSGINGAASSEEEQLFDPQKESLINIIAGDPMKLLHFNGN